MIRKDFLDRQLEEFGKVVARLRLLISNREREKFEEELRLAFAKYTPLEISAIERLNDTLFLQEVVSNVAITQDGKKNDRRPPL